MWREWLPGEGPSGSAELHFVLIVAGVLFFMWFTMTFEGWLLEAIKEVPQEEKPKWQRRYSLFTFWCKAIYITFVAVVFILYLIW